MKLALWGTCASLEEICSLLHVRCTLQDKVCQLNWGFQQPNPTESGPYPVIIIFHEIYESKKLCMGEDLGARIIATSRGKWF